ncbi:MAG: GNAT family N-acetyltransferase [Chloroflexi bacterium]|nr:GNAT family N-acetyltransferase [Chloroflexota bacterium]
MVITIPASAQSSRQGLRPINLNKDIPQVIKLLELVFGYKLGGNGQRLFSSETGFTQPAFLWRLNPMSSKLALGYVWEEDGRIIGNGTLLTTSQSGRYLVVNVAVHPDFRRRGIARNLMDALIQLAQTKQGREILLQVVKENEAAITLYETMRFQTVGHMTTWHSSVSRLRDIEPTVGGRQNPVIREMPRRSWQAAYQLDAKALSPDLNWPEPLPRDAYKLNLWRRFENFLNGRHAEVWAATNEANQLTGLAGIWSEWSRPHQVTLRVHPAWQGQLERPLLAKTIHRLHRLPHRNIRVDHPDDDKCATALLREANFQPRRTLRHMRLDITI